MDWAPHMRRILSNLGEDATFTHGTGQASSVRGLYLSPYAEILPGGFGSGIDVTKPHFAVMTADVPLVTQGDTIICSGGTFDVVTPEADAPSGITVLRLEKQ